jgi:hypothetical protein
VVVVVLLLLLCGSYAFGGWGVSARWRGVCHVLLLLLC